MYDHYASPATPQNTLQIPETKKRVKLNAVRRDSGIGYSSEENSPSQSPLPTNEVKFQLPVTPETPKKVFCQYNIDQFDLKQSYRDGSMTYL